MARPSLRALAALLAGALSLTAASSVVESTRPEVQDWDCPPAAASCARPVVVVGFPIPYISDFHGISPVGSADLIGALLGEDHFHAGAFWGDVAVYLALLAAARALAGRRRAQAARVLAPALLVLACACAGTTARPAPPTGQHPRTLETTLTRRVSARYLLHLPADYGREPGRRWPLILYLHGGSLRGDDVDTVRVWGVPRLAERDPAFPFIVVSPQAAPGTLWTDTGLLAALLDEVTARYAVDPARVYLTGHSMGGNGTWYLAYTYPERFAAIVPMSGPANPWWAGRLRNVPVWVFHGGRDSVVSVRESEEMVRALQEAGNREVRFTRLPDRDHGLLDLYEDGALYDWLLQHRRP